jgi:hypothetical protein
MVAGWVSVAAAGEPDVATPTKEPTRAPAKKEAAVIKDTEALKYVQQRLEAQTGVRGWKIELKEPVGSSKDFTASVGDRTETGSVNILKSYPNQGIHRVYVTPKD